MIQTFKTYGLTLGLVILWLSVIAFDNWLRPEALNQDVGFTKLLCFPALAVFGWPLGIWLWGRIHVESERVDRAPLYVFAALAWLLAGLMDLLYLKVWLFG